MTNARETYRFDGAITAVTGLAVTRPDEKFPSPNDSQIRLSSNAARLPRLGPLREESLCYFPATSLRGAIRRAGRNVIRRAVIKETGNETPWSVDTHYMLTQGVDTTNKTIKEKTSGAIGAESDLRDANPFLSLFGRWRLPGHFCIDNAIPDDKDCIYVEGRGARSNDFVRSPEQAGFLSAEDAKSLKTMLEQDAIVAGLSGDIDKDIKALMSEYRNAEDADEKREISEQRKALEAKKKEMKAAKKGSQESIQRPLEGFEAIRPGTRMGHRMILQNSDDTELGLALASLRELARSPYVGGHRALHCGEISGSWSVSCWPEDANKPIALGTVKLSSSGFDVEDEPGQEVLSKAFSAWENKAVAPKAEGLDFERFLLVG